MGQYYGVHVYKEEFPQRANRETVLDEINQQSLLQKGRVNKHNLLSQHTSHKSQENYYLATKTKIGGNELHSEARIFLPDELEGRNLKDIIVHNKL